MARMTCLLTVEEAADRLSLSERTLRKLISGKAIRHIRIGRVIRIEECELARLVERNAVAPRREVAL